MPATLTRATCAEPVATEKTFNSGRGDGPMAWCSACKSWKPSTQVPWGREKRNADGRILATYAPVPHGLDAA